MYVDVSIHTHTQCVYLNSVNLINHQIFLKQFSIATMYITE